MESLRSQSGTSKYFTRSIERGCKVRRWASERAALFIGSRNLLVFDMEACAAVGKHTVCLCSEDVQTVCILYMQLIYVLKAGLWPWSLVFVAVCSPPFFFGASVFVCFYITLYNRAANKPYRPGHSSSCWLRENILQQFTFMKLDRETDGEQNNKFLVC